MSDQSTVCVCVGVGVIQTQQHLLPTLPSYYLVYLAFDDSAFDTQILNETETEMQLKKKLPQVSGCLVGWVGKGIFQAILPPPPLSKCPQCWYLNDMSFKNAYFVPN